MFLVPWPGHWLIGTTDAPYDGPIDRPTAGADEVDELLAAVEPGPRRRPRGATTWSGRTPGLRPLIAPSSGSTVTASREHRVVVEANGLVRVSGGKYTTYRVMAARRDRRGRSASSGSSRRTGRAATAGLGARRRGGSRSARTALAAPARERTRLAPASRRELVDRHGTQAAEVAALGARDGPARTLGPGIDHLEAEVAWAAREEMALSLDDVLAAADAARP